MRAKEEIALEITKSILENSNLAKFNNVAVEVSKVYNGIYNGIETKNKEPIEVLK